MFEGFARSRSITRKHAYVKHAWFQLLSVSLHYFLHKLTPSSGSIFYYVIVQAVC